MTRKSKALLTAQVFKGQTIVQDYLGSAGFVAMIHVL